MGDTQKDIEIPSFFVCPISLEIMKDPVTLSTGITYDRDAIEKWLYTSKNGTCPLTKQVLTDVELTPNHTLRRLIQSWCTINAPFGIERFPTPRLPVSKSQILKLLQDSKSPSLQMKSLKRLKTIVLESDMNKRSMEAVGAADYLSYIIRNPSSNLTSSSPAGEVSGVDGFGNLLTAVDEAVSILYHLHLSQAGLKSLFGKTEEFVEALIHVMQRAANYESRTYAVLLLKSMFEVAEPIQVMSLKTHVFIELTQILAHKISEKATKAALKILIGVCPWGRNRIKAVEAGAVSVLIDTLLDSTEKRVSEMVLILLEQLCKSADGRAELLKHGAGLAVVSKKIFRVSEAASGRAVRILHSVAMFSGNTSVIQEMLQLGVARKLFLVVQSSCGGKTSEKAMEILKMHAKAWKNSSCMPYHLNSWYPS
ncbi:E3 ubiquitin-protein ligase PUB23-like [Cynara cardunculus var. scolymus]|uniref:U-box domain-containing protein n=1 Tax=Cynara cardunculus var. scolymus TaxID=59895 RepID=A0A103YFT5_CYNCS|nr:E3 ubiquitin-protein ligase PUB23-like [Cynara cardunculus var. scolymus]KVI08314.1 Armadillo-like helical [Cynara cardunculus var. scolymus]